jgi:hypothetical protein
LYSAHSLAVTVTPQHDSVHNLLVWGVQASGAALHYFTIAQQHSSASTMFVRTAADCCTPALCPQAEVRLPYVTCEFYLGMLSHLAPAALWLGSVPGLRMPTSLAKAATSHVLLLCRTAPSSHLELSAGSNAPTVPADDGSRARAHAVVLEALSDPGVRAAVRSCAAAGAACTLVPLPPPQVHTLAGLIASVTTFKSSCCQWAAAW